jgi:hypothetical protein
MNYYDLKGKVSQMLITAVRRGDADFKVYCELLDLLDEQILRGAPVSPPAQRQCDAYAPEAPRQAAGYFLPPRPAAVETHRVHLPVTCSSGTGSLYL